MTAHPIPQSALDDRLFFGGTSGSGKTYGAGTAVERLLNDGARVVIPDPLGVWWGLAMAEDGRHPSVFRKKEKLVIFGGPRGDLGLTENSGALIGETVAGMAESCILDLSELKTGAAERRFMLAFLTALYAHKTREPLHVVFDEADLWAPQRVLDKEGDAMKLLGMMENICRRGRVKGFIPWLISQRPAVISKNVLSQIDGMIAFKLTSVQDRDAIGDWVQGQADKAEWIKTWGNMPTLERGQGLVWLPARGILKTAQFPTKITFDSSRAPERGKSVESTTPLQPVNLDKLKERLSKVEAETKANDPRVLRAENAKLKSEKTALEKQVAAKAVADPDAIEKAEKRGFERAEKQLRTQMRRELSKKLKEGLASMRKHAVEAIERIDDELREINAKDAELLIEFTPSAPKPAPRSAPSAAPQMPPRAKPVAPTGNGAIPGPQQRILDSLATWQVMGVAQPSNAQVAWLARYSPSSTSYTNPRSALRTAGLIEYPSGDLVSLTEAGIALAVAQQIHGDLGAYVLDQLKGPERRILAGLVERYPNAVSNEEAAEAANYSASSTSYTNPRSALRTKELITYPSNGFVRAADWLFPAGRMAA